MSTLRILRESSKRVMERAAARYQRARVSGINEQIAKWESAAEIRAAVREMMSGGSGGAVWS